MCVHEPTNNVFRLENMLSYFNSSKRPCLLLFFWTSLFVCTTIYCNITLFLYSVLAINALCRYCSTDVRVIFQCCSTDLLNLGKC